MRKIFLTTAVVGLSATLPASATTITGWNLDNVAPGAVPAPNTTEVSTIFVDNDQLDSNGQIAYTDPEARTPGLTALNDFYTSGQGTFDGCIRAEVGGTDCATGFQTGNRFKLQLTDTGAVDLVFDVDPNMAGTQGSDVGSDPATPGINTYQVFGRAINLTGAGIDSFELQLGFGVGDGFTASTADDGLGFALGLELGPENLAAFTQYPFGLFGDADGNQRTDLDGFYNDGRSGFNVLLSEDSIVSSGFYENLLGEGNNGSGYQDLFGTWLSRDMAPAGLLWDNDENPETDALVMAWFNKDLGVSGMWEALRDIDEGGVAISILTNPLTWATQEEAAAYFTDQGALIDFEPNIEDIANLNLNFGIELADAFFGWGDDAENKNFTLRLTSVGAPVSPVPLPAGAPLLLASFAMIGFLRKRRAA